MLFDPSKLPLYGILQSDFLSIIEEIVTDEVTEDEAWTSFITEHNTRAIRVIKGFITDKEYDDIADVTYDEDLDKKADITLAELYFTGCFMKEAFFAHIQDGFSAESNEGVSLTKEQYNKIGLRFYNKAMGLLRLHYDID